MIRFLFLLHRYLGIGIGILMVLWTVSGIVLMYKQYPELNRWESLSLREPLTLENCCVLPVSPITRADTFSAVHVEMLDGAPVLRLYTLERGLVGFRLDSGRAFERISAETSHAVAERFVRTWYPQQRITAEEVIHNDQWTVYGSYDPHRPLTRYHLDDKAGTQFYLSSRSGEIVQVTTFDQRLWGYLGAVIHWIYPTSLRQNPPLWTQVVIWLSLIGVFLTVTGIYIGIRQFRFRSTGRLSPYRGMALWHHYAGLVFGVFTLTWIFSGLLSMNPLDALSGEGAGPEMQRLNQGPLDWSDVEPVLAKLGTTDLPDSTVLLEIYPQAGTAAITANLADGGKVRLDANSLQVEKLSEHDLQTLAELLQPSSPIRSTGLQTDGDAYYFAHHEPVEFPVYRVIMADAQNRRYYLSAADGRLLQKVDDGRRWYRWLFEGLHRLDFTARMRSRPLWDIFMVLLLVGVAGVCGTGTWMGWKSLSGKKRSV